MKGAARVGSLGALCGGLTALWVYNVWSRSVRVQDDRDVLASMARRPLRLTEHAACRMDCRCAQGGVPSVRLWRRPPIIR